MPFRWSLYLIWFSRTLAQKLQPILLENIFLCSKWGTKGHPAFFSPNPCIMETDYLTNTIKLNSLSFMVFSPTAWKCVQKRSIVVVGSSGPSSVKPFFWDRDSIFSGSIALPLESTRPEELRVSKPILGPETVSRTWRISRILAICIILLCAGRFFTFLASLALYSRRHVRSQCSLRSYWVGFSFFVACALTSALIRNIL